MAPRNMETTRNTEPHNRNNNSNSYDNDLSEPLLTREDDQLSLLLSTNDDQPEVVSRNVTLTLAYTLIVYAGRSVWSYSVLATYIFLLRSGNAEAVGYITAAQGLAQLLASFPTGFIADRYRRDSALKLSSVIGVIAMFATIYSVSQSSYQLLVVALSIWGIFWGIANTSLTALFADSIREGKRTHYFTQRAILLNIGSVTGPFVALLMFFYLGDTWTVRECSIVLFVGQALSIPAIILLCFMSDDHAEDHGPQALNNNNDNDNNDKNNDEQENLVDHGVAPSDEQQISTADRKFCCCFETSSKRFVPGLIALADVTAGLASGMSIRYFPIFLYDNLHLGPVIVQVLYMISPLVQATLMKVAQYLSVHFGRCQVAAVFKWTGIALMLCMIVSYLNGLPVWLICTILILRTAFMNSTSALTKSVLMDAVPKEERAKWGALESVNMFSWSGSAALGGVLVGYEGIIFNFCVTAFLQFLATFPLVILFSVDEKTNNNENNVASEGDDNDEEEATAAAAPPRSSSQ